MAQTPQPAPKTTPTPKPAPTTSTRAVVTESTSKAFKDGAYPQPQKNTVNANESRVTAPSGTTGTGGDAPAGGDNPQKTIVVEENIQQQPKQEIRFSHDDIKNVITVEDPQEQEILIDQITEGMDEITVKEFRKEVEKAKITDTPKHQGEKHKKPAGDIHDIENPNDPRLDDDKFDIKEGDIIDFLMKEVVLAYAAWVGQKATNHLGYVIYKRASDFYHWGQDSDEAADQAEKNKKDNNKKKNSNPPEDVKGNDTTSEFAQNILHMRQEMFNGNGYVSPELQTAREVKKHLEDFYDGKLDLANAKAGKNSVEVTKTTKDKDGNPQTEVVKIDKKVFKQLQQINDNLEKAYQQYPNEPKDKIRQQNKAFSIPFFDKKLQLLEAEAVYTADYAAALMLEKASRKSKDEVANINYEQEFNNLVRGEARLSFWHKIYDIEHEKEGAYKDTPDKPAVNTIKDDANNALTTSLALINSGQYKEKGKEPTANPHLPKILLNGESEYAPEFNQMSQEQQDKSLAFMVEDAAYGYHRQGQKESQLTIITQNINALEGDAQDVAQRRNELQARKKQLKGDYTQETQKRDTQRLNHFKTIQERGN